MVTAPCRYLRRSTSHWGPTVHHLLPTFSDEVTAKVLVITLTFLADLIRQTSPRPGGT